MHSNIVGEGPQSFQLQELDIELLGLLWSDDGVKADGLKHSKLGVGVWMGLETDRHAVGLHAERHFFADAPQPDDGQRFATELVACEELPVPAASLQRGAGR